MGLRKGRVPRVAVCVNVVCVVLILINFAHAQGIQTSPYSSASVVQDSGFAPANPLRNPAAPRESDSIYLSSGMFHDLVGSIPNLQVGYLYSFGQRVRTGRLTLDYVLPVSLSRDSTVFGEAHSEFSDFWKTIRGAVNNRVDISVGGGYRRMLGDKTLIGVNAFYDSARLAGTWYASGGCGFEMASELPGNDAFDLYFNWYGNLFNRSVILDAFRTGPANYDFQAGYSHELWNGGPDLRLSATGYRFDAGFPVWGMNAGAELKSRDGMFVLRYQIGSDKLNKTYQTVGAFVNLGLRLENLAEGESPFTMPEPIFRSPRNLRRWLSRSLSTIRNFHQPAAALTRQRIVSQGPQETPYFVFQIASSVSGGTMTYTQDPGNATGTLTVDGSIVTADWYTLTIVGTSGLSFPVTATITPSTGGNADVYVAQSGNWGATESVQFPDRGTLTRQIPCEGLSSTPPDCYEMPQVRPYGDGDVGTITITAPGVQTLTITVVSNFVW